MKAADLVVLDPLAACLSVIAKLHGRPASPEALKAGLPLEHGRLTPDLAGRAAQRASLEARAVKIRLDQLAPGNLPALLMLHDGGACVITRIEGGAANLLFPKAPHSEQNVSLSELSSLYSGDAILFSRLERFDAGTASERLAQQHHWFWGTLKKEARTYVEVAIATALINILALASPLFFMNVYDRVVPNHAYETLWVLALGLGMVLAFDLVLKMLRSYFIDLAGKHADLALSAALFARVMDMKLDQPRQSAGTLAGNLREFESLRDFFTSATLASIVDLPFLLIFLAAIFSIGGLPLALPVIVAIPIVVGVGLALQPALRDHIRRTFAATEAKFSTVIETLSAIEQVKHLNAASQLQRKWESLVRFVAAESLTARLLTSFALNFTGSIQAIVSMVVLVIGAYMAIDARLSMGGLIACVILTGRAVAPLGQLAGLLTRYHNAMTALAALNRIMEAPVEREPGKTFISRARLEGSIELRGVTFRYPGQLTDAIRDLSIEIPAGSRVGVIGRMGSGKSTLARLLAGLHHPQAGIVLADGIDTRQIDPADLRRNIGYLPQNVVLFSGTVRENLTIGVPQAEDDALLRAVRLVGLDDHLNRHPQGFDLQVGERGDALSGGQKQAIALARALLTDPPVLLLDEPTSAMDIGSEEQLKARLAGALGSRTLIIITHRESMLTLVDSLVVMDSGRIVASGPKGEVLKALAQGRVRKVG